MMIKNRGFYTGLSFKAIVLTVILTAIMFGSKPLTGKKVSPVMLFVISAVLGIAVYGV